MKTTTRIRRRVLAGIALFVAASGASCSCCGAGGSAKGETPVDAGLSAWRETGEWSVVGAVKSHSDDEKRLSAEPGNGVLVNRLADGKDVDLITVAEYGDVDLHVEFLVPRGSNSGVYVMGRYELQILDSFGKDEVTFGDCGGIYERYDTARGEGKEGYEGYPPRLNASLPAGEWQSFDIQFRAPRFDSSGKRITPARFVKVVHNDVIVHEDVEVSGPTRAALYEHEPEAAKGPLQLQGDHGPVAYRNIRIRSLGN